MSVTPGDPTPQWVYQGHTYHFCSASCRAKFQQNPGKSLCDHDYDLIIVGGGPGGLAAGIYASLGGVDTLLLSRSIGGQAWDSTEVFNYPGFAFVTGPDLVKRFQQQAFEDLHLAHRITAVAEVVRAPLGFEVRAEGGETFRARAVLYTAGMRRRRLGIPGEADLAGRGVAVFHALAAERYRDQAVAVVGGGNSAVQAALGLAAAGARVSLVTRGFRADAYLQEKVTAAPAITLLRDRNSVRVEGTGRVEALIVQATSGGPEERLAVVAVFVEVGLVPNNEPVRELVKLNHRGEVEIDSNGRTPVPGLFAAGDVTTAYGKRILIAAGEGAKAALAAQEYLRDGRGDTR
jgi:alkyl hydroperoxide reductase subunit F